MLRRQILAVPALAAAGSLARPALAQDRTLNLYSSRHYDTDRAL